MKKILFLANTFPVDQKLSSGVFNFNAAKQLSKVCDLTIIHLRAWHPKRKFIEYKSINGLNFICFSFPFRPVRNNFLTGFQLFIYAFFLRIFLSNLLNKQDIIHSVGASFSGVVGAFLSKKLNKPHIAQCIGTDVNVTLVSQKDSFFYSVMKSHVNIFTTNSYALEEQVRKLYPRKKIKTIYRGVNLNFFDLKNDHSKVDNKIILAYIGGLAQRSEHFTGRDYKGGITLLKAWLNLKEFNNIELNFAGPEVSEKLVNEIINKDCKKFNIKVLGNLTRLQVKELFQTADIVVIPSWLEGLPNAGMEALASSCAVIASDTGGIPELINENGYLFTPGDTKLLSELIKKLISSPEKLREFKVNSRLLSERKFNSSQFSKQYCNLYEEI